MMIFTQSYRDSGLEQLIPTGIVIARSFYTNKGDLTKLKEEIEKKYPEVNFVFNSKFEWYLLGHPGNSEIHGCYMTGDGYKLPEEAVLEDKKRKVRKGWQFKCGLVILEEGK